MHGLKIEFWYEFASTYSYLAAMRIEALAGAAGVPVEWKPFLLGPIFQAQGWTTSPFIIYPAKGRYMVRDMERIAGERGLEFQMPEPFPQNGLAAARVALVGAEAGWIGAFSREVYRSAFAMGADISRRETLVEALRRVDEMLGHDADRILARSGEAGVKERLKEQTALAQNLGIFGAPTFRVAKPSGEDAGELFWGDDRLEQAIAWALAGR